MTLLTHSLLQGAIITIGKKVLLSQIFAERFSIFFLGTFEKGKPFLGQNGISDKTYTKNTFCYSGSVETMQNVLGWEFLSYEKLVMWDNTGIRTLIVFQSDLAIQFFGGTIQRVKTSG